MQACEQATWLARKSARSMNMVPRALVALQVTPQGRASAAPGAPGAGYRYQLT
jgi:hypothetical protein